jgi:hypothetical protein
LAAAGLLYGTAQAVEADAFQLRNFGDLASLCGAGEGPYQAEALQLCRGYILGAGSLYLELVRAGAIEAWACAEPTPTVDEARLRIVAWAKANPSSHSEQAIDGLWRAAASIWPCKS